MADVKSKPVRYEMSQGQDFVVPAYDGPVPDGMVFSHWSTNPDGTGMTYRPGETIRKVHGQMHIYKQFRRADE